MIVRDLDIRCVVVKTLEERIDAVAGTWRWLPEREEHRRVCRKEDGTTEL